LPLPLNEIAKVRRIRAELAFQLRAADVHVVAQVAEAWIVYRHGRQVARRADNRDRVGLRRGQVLADRGHPGCGEEGVRWCRQSCLRLSRVRETVMLLDDVSRIGFTDP